ncbi:hypothetical protein EG68_02316 [Paragonimus skrjabini miyazakii]|uniref:Uncharacterized protein n=1 Tax=Paragonimus skrjabini miyazakii TaxID=59628 RepID=A0A8S9Z3A3_9TREM|nr:hypothetical protein EG68_02316 [Paragonimus skrjabini miyazakii]
MNLLSRDLNAHTRSHYTPQLSFHDFSSLDKLSFLYLSDRSASLEKTSTNESYNRPTHRPTCQVLPQFGKTVTERPAEILASH